MHFNLIDLEYIVIPMHIISETEKFCRTKGKQYNEAKVYWIGKMLSKNTASINRVYIPQQIPIKSVWGVSVEVPEKSNIDLINNLQDQELALVKLHTHPSEAYLSYTDLNNPFFRHEGAVSIVIPEFCIDSLDNLTHCCVNIFKKGEWQELSKKEIENIFKIGEL